MTTVCAIFNCCICMPAVQMPLEVLPRMRHLWILTKGLMSWLKQTALQLKVVQGHRPLIAEHKVVGLLTSAVHSVDVYRTVPTLKAVFQLWLLIEETVSVQKLVMWYMFILYAHYWLEPLFLSGPTDCQWPHTTSSCPGGTMSLMRWLVPHRPAMFVALPCLTDHISLN